MNRKKNAGKPVTRGRLTLASVLAGGTGQNALQPTQAEQPWRNKKPLGKNRGRK